MNFAAQSLLASSHVSFLAVANHCGIARPPARDERLPGRPGCTLTRAGIDAPTDGVQREEANVFAQRVPHELGRERMSLSRYFSPPKQRLHEPQPVITQAWPKHEHATAPSCAVLLPPGHALQ